MAERRFVKVGGVAGVVFVVTLLAGGIVEGNTPSLDGSSSKITSYVTAHRHALIATGIFGAGSMVFLLIFLATLVHVTTEDGRGSDQLPRVVGYTGTATAVCFALVQAPATTVAILAAQPRGLQDTSLVRSLLDMSSVIEGPYYLMASVLVLTMGLVAVRRRILGVWFGWLGVVLSIVNAAAGGVAMAVVSGGARSATSGLAGVGLTILVLILSVVFLRVKLPTSTGVPNHLEPTAGPATA